MKNLICADLLKLRRSLGYKLILLAPFILGMYAWYITIVVHDSKSTGLSFLESSVRDFQYISSFVAIFAGIFISSEFANRTFGIAVSAGNKRLSVFFSKVIVLLIGVLPMVVSIAAPLVLLTSISNEFAPQVENPQLYSYQVPVDLSGSSYVTFSHHSDEMLNYLASVGAAAYTVRIVILSLLLAVVIGCLHILLAFYIKNVAGTIGAGIFITFVLEHLQRFYVGEYRFREILINIFTYQAELTPIYVIVCVVLIAAMLGIALRVFQRTELK